MARGKGIGVVNVALGVDASAFEKGLQDAASRLQTFASRISKIGAIAGAAMAGVAAGVAAGVRKTLTEVDRLGNVARQIGVPIEKLSELKYAAEQTGVGFETMSSGMQTLAQNMAKAAADSKSQVALAFQAIGVSVRDANGNLRASSDVLSEVAQKFSGFRDDAGKSALAMQLFGSAGAQMIPVLNQGSDGLARMADEARQLGLVISRDTEQRAKEFNGTLTRIAKTFDAVWLQVSSELLPVFQALAERLRTVASSGETVKTWASALTEAFKYVVTVGERLIATLQTLKLAYSSFWDETGKETSLADYLSRIAAGYAKIREEYDRSIAGLSGKDMAEELGIGALNAALEKAAKNATPVVRSTAEIARAEGEFAKAMRVLNERARERRQLLVDTLPVQERFATEVQKLSAALNREIITAEEFARALEHLRAEYSGFADVMKGMESSFEGAFVDAVTGAKKLQDALKDLLGSVAKLFAQAAFRQAFGSMFDPAGGGASNPIASFFSKLFKFQHGGSFTVGGSGGTDSQVVAFRATPGERVNIDRAGTMPGGAVLQPKVVVNNYAQASVDSQTQDDGTLIMTVRAITRDELGAQSAQPVMAGAYGVRPRIRSR